MYIYDTEVTLPVQDKYEYLQKEVRTRMWNPMMPLLFYVCVCVSCSGRRETVGGAEASAADGREGIYTCPCELNRVQASL